MSTRTPTPRPAHRACCLVERDFLNNNSLTVQRSVRLKRVGEDRPLVGLESLLPTLAQIATSSHRLSALRRAGHDERNRCFISAGTTVIENVW